MTTQDQPLVEREAIARIVDPGPWGHLDCVLELPEGARGGETYAVNACKPSLAKAAEIQALLSTSRPETEAKLAEGRFWLTLREPGRVPELKGPWPQERMAATLREAIAARPTAYIDVLTWSCGQPEVQHGPEALQMIDGRSMSAGRKHNARVREAEAKLAAPTEELVKRARAEIARNDVDTAAEQAFDALADHLVSTASKLAAVVAERDEALATNASTYETLTAEVALRDAAESRLSGVLEALEPFAKMAEHLEDEREDARFDLIDNRPGIDGAPDFTKADFNRARTALQSAREGEGRLRPSGLGEPIAWSYELATHRWPDGRYDGWELRLGRTSPHAPEGSVRNLTPLYANPEPGSAP